eukprot:357659-Chlamydomonas_euryale.AAC.1
MASNPLPVASSVKLASSRPTTGVSSVEPACSHQRPLKHDVRDLCPTPRAAHTPAGPSFCGGQRHGPQLNHGALDVLWLRRRLVVGRHPPGAQPRLPRTGRRTLAPCKCGVGCQSWHESRMSLVGVQGPSVQGSGV